MESQYWSSSQPPVAHQLTSASVERVCPQDVSGQVLGLSEGVFVSDLHSIGRGEAGSVYEYYG